MSALWLFDSGVPSLYSENDDFFLGNVLKYINKGQVDIHLGLRHEARKILSVSDRHYYSIAIGRWLPDFVAECLANDGFHRKLRKFCAWKHISWNISLQMWCWIRSCLNRAMFYCSNFEWLSNCKSLMVLIFLVGGVHWCNNIYQAMRSIGSYYLNIIPFQAEVSWNRLTSALPCDPTLPIHWRSSNGTNN